MLPVANATIKALRAFAFVRRWIKASHPFCGWSLTQKLKDKKQSAQQRMQAVDAVSIFYKIKKKKTVQDKAKALKNKKDNISTKKTVLKSTNADWSPVYIDLDSEIKALFP